MDQRRISEASAGNDGAATRIGDCDMSGDSPTESVDRRNLEQAIEAHREHVALQRWYREIREFDCPMPPLGVVTFVMAVFRDRRLGALVWSDGSDSWGTSGWLVLTADGSFPQNTIGLPPIAHRRTFPDVLDVILVQHDQVSQPQRAWWQFWR